MDCSKIPFLIVSRVLMSSDCSIDIVTVLGSDLINILCNVSFFFVKTGMKLQIIIIKNKDKMPCNSLQE